MAVRERALLVSGAVLAFLATGEAVLHIAGYTSERNPKVARLHDAEWTTLLDCYATNPWGRFDIDLRGTDARARYEHLAPQRFDAIVHRAPYAVMCRYNRLRFRERPPTPKRPGIFRIAVVGDSFTEGQGVPEADTYPRRLEAALNAREPGRFEVMNCGRRGQDFPELYGAFEDALLYEPDIVLYGMVLNDAARSPEFQARQQYLNDWILLRGREEEEEADEPAALDSRLWDLVRDRADAWRIGRASTHWYLDMYGEPNREGWMRTQQLIRRMDRRMRERGGRFTAALWPLLVDLGPAYPFGGPRTTIRRFYEAAGIPFADLHEALAVRNASSLWVHPLDHHPNDEAHRLAAEALAPLLARLVYGGDQGTMSKPKQPVLPFTVAHNVK